MPRVMNTPAKTAPTTSGFIQWLYGLAEANDRARLAALRRGLMLDRHQLYELYRVIPPQFLDGASDVDARRRTLLAALFAAHPLFFPETAADGPARRRNLGHSLRLLAERQPADEAGELPETLKRRMDILLSAHADDVFAHLQQVIRLLKAAEIPVDWGQLLWDLRGWDRDDRRVQWEWSRSFYVGRSREGGETDVS